MKKVLVPIDFSKESLIALAYVRMLFSEVPCKFYLLNAYLSYRTDVMNEEFNDGTLYTNSEESINELKLVLDHEKQTNSNRGHQFEAVSIADSLVNAIKTFTKEIRLDYIAMAARGKGSINALFFGSNTVRVINGIDHCPILVVPQNPEIKKPKQMVFSTNFKRDFNKDELRPLLGLVRLWNLKVKIVQIMGEDELNDAQKKHKKALKQLLVGLDYFFHQIKVHTSEAEAIRDFAKNTQSDVISLVHHKYNFLWNLVQENVVKRVAFNSPVPILILQELD